MLAALWISNKYTIDGKTLMNGVFLMKKQLAAWLAPLVLLSACQTETGAPAPSPSQEVNAVADAYMASIREIAPFAFLYSGLGADVEIANDAFDDISPEAYAAFEATEDALAARLDQIDGSALSGADWVTYETVKENIASSRGARTS